VTISANAHHPPSHLIYSIVSSDPFSNNLSGRLCYTCCIQRREVPQTFVSYPRHHENSFSCYSLLFFSVSFRFSSNFSIFYCHSSLFSYISVSYIPSIFLLFFYSPLSFLLLVTCQRIARQRLDKYPAIRARNRTNVYSSLLGNSQRANGLTRYLSRDLFSVWSALRNNRTVFSALSVPRLYNTSPGESRAFTSRS
jgi:hypothetical protein